jgi:putative transcriptional regulator
MSVYKDIIKSLDEAIEYEKGNLKAKRRTVVVQPLAEYKSSEIRNLRLQLEFSQVAFASVLGVSPKTIEAWEAGRNQPSGPARRMLELISNDKTTVRQFVQII